MINWHNNKHMCMRPLNFYEPSDYFAMVTGLYTQIAQLIYNHIRFVIVRVHLSDIEQMYSKHMSV